MTDKGKVVPPVRFRGRVINLSEIRDGTKISTSHLSRIFSGQRTPSLDYATRIAAFLNVSMDTLAAELRGMRK